MGKGYYIGVDVGGTKINMGIVDGRGNILSKRKIPTESGKGWVEIAERITSNIDAMLDDTGIGKMDVESIGFGVPGTVDADAGIVIFAPNIGWRDIPFVEYMSDKTRLKTYIAQDTQAAAWGEFLFGAGRGCDTMICITLGTGIGSGIIINGHIYKGGLGSAGEIGHIIVQKNGRACNCGRKGCLEAYAGGLAIAQIAKERIPGFKDDMTCETVFAMATAGNIYAKGIIDDAIAYIGIGMVNALNLISPQKVIISGGMSNQTDLVESIKNFVRENGYSIAADRVIIERAQLGDDAPMIGAAMLYRC